MKQLAILLLVVGCGEPLRDDVTPLEELDYKSWKQVQVHGDAPAHPGFRTIYANDVARDATQFRIGYGEGAILVKEVFNDDNGQKGSLRHIAVMRRIGEVTRALEDDDAGWYFTEAAAGGKEKHFDFCFRRCHASAPYNGAWLDYRD